MSAERLKNILELLRSLQWRWDLTGYPCPECRNGYKYGHSVDCEIAKAMVDIEHFLNADSEVRFVEE